MLSPNLSRPASGFRRCDGGQGGEPLKTMTADTITAERIESLRALFKTALDTFGILAEEVEFSAIDPAEAAAIVNETIHNLTIEAR